MRTALYVAIIAYMLSVGAAFASSTLSIQGISPNNVVIDNGQSLALTATWSGGTSPYTVTWYTGPSNNYCQQDSANVLATYSSITGTTNTLSVSPSTTNSYCIKVIDSATPNAIQFSSNYTIANTITSGFSPELEGIAISPDGSYAYVMGYGYGSSGNVAIVNTATNTVTGAITGLTGGLSAAAFSPDGSYAYVTNQGSSNVLIVSTATNTVVNSITSGFYQPTDAAFSPSNTYAYITNRISNNVVIINTATNTVTNAITAGISNPYGIAISPDGSYAYVTNSGSNNVVIINTATNTVTGSITSGFNNPTGVAFSPSGAYAYVANYNSYNVVIINTATNTVTGVITYSGFSAPWGIAFSPTDNFVYISNNNNDQIIVLIPGTGSEITKSNYYRERVNPTLSTPSLNPNNPSLDPAQSVAFGSAWSGGTSPYSITLYSSSTSTCNTGSTLIRTFSSLTVNAVAFNSLSPSSATYYCTFVTDNAYSPATTNSVTSKVSLSTSLGTPSISPSTTQTVFAGKPVTFSSSWSGGTSTYGATLRSSSTSTCNIYSTVALQQLGIATTSLTFPAAYPTSTSYYCIFVTDNAISSHLTSTVISSSMYGTQSVAISPDGSYAYVGNSNANNVVIINTATNTVTGAITTGINNPRAMAFSPDGTFAYVANQGSNNVVIINTATNTVTGTITAGIYDPTGVAFSPDGSYAYVVDYLYSNVVIINTATNTVVNAITTGISEPSGVAFSPDGTFAYVPDYANSDVSIINTASNTVTGTITSGFYFPSSVSFSPSGTYAYITNQQSNNVVIINTATNTVVSAMSSNIQDPTSIAISPDGTYAYLSNHLGSPSDTGNITIIDTGPLTTNSVSIKVNVLPALVAGVITPINPSVKSGQSVTLYANASGGTSPYTYNWYTIAGTTTPTCTTANQITGQNANSLSVSPTSTNSYAYQVVDSASPNNVECSAGDTAIPFTPPIFPSNIVAYVPIIVTNYQSTAVTANTPIAIGTDSGGNIIGFNAVAYQQYETCNLNNAEFFLANGTVLNSWMEGNIIYEQTANALCTSASSPNALSASANILYWIDAPAGFLPANTGTATTNTVYLGWTGNVITTENTLLTNSIGPGEAPQLSCTNPANTISGCTAGQYAKYDNGNTVFGANTAVGYYQNWAGNTLPSGWTNTASITPTANNGLTLSSASSSQFYSHNTLLNPSYIVEMYAQTLVKTSGFAMFNLLQQTQTTSPSNWAGVAEHSSYYPYWLYTSAVSTNTKSNSATTWAINTYYVSTVSMASSSQNYLVDYNSVATSSFTSPSNEYSGVWMDGGDESLLQWYRVRAYPPSDTQPQTTYGSAVLASCTATITNPTNSVVDVGQYESFTAAELSCTSPYSYNILVVNSISTGTVTHNDLLTGQASSTETYSFQTTSTDNSNSPEKANVIVTGSGASAVASSYSTTFTVNPALGTPTLSSVPSLPSTQNAGNTITFTATVSGGTTPYSYNYILTNTVTGTVVANQLYTGISTTSNSFVWTIPSNMVGNTIQANVIVTDSATIPETTNSIKSNKLTIIVSTTTIPAGIVAYLPITLTNYQSTAVAANTPIAIGTDSGGNIIGFNAVAYQQYETCNLNNAEFFLANGTVLNSWMEGNVLNSNAANSLCTSDASPNALAASSNVLYWVDMPSGFLSANTGTPNTSTIYLGWTGNTLTTANNLLSNTTTGENPYISSTFGQYDNGGNVFSLYSTFQGNTMPSGWAPVSESGTYVPTFNGGTSSTGGVEMMNNVGGQGTALSYNSAFSTPNVIVEAGWMYGGGADNLGIGIYANSINPAGGGYEPYAKGGYYASYEFWTGEPEFLSNGNNWGQASTSYMSSSSGNHYVMSKVTLTDSFATVSLATNNNIMYESPVYNSSVSTTLTSVNTISNANTLFYIGAGDGGASSYIYLYWLRARLYPPNGILPETTYGSVQQAPCSITITNPSNAIVDVGQYESFTATSTNCASPYTYNVLVANSITPSTITHNDLVTGSTSSQLTYTFQTTSTDNSNSPEEANAVITDSTSNTVPSSYSSTFTTNPTLGTPTLSSSPSLPSSQEATSTITFTTAVTGGSSPYTYNYQVVNTITGTVIANMLFTNVASTTNSFAWTILTADVGNTVQANVMVTDSASTPETTNSVKSGTLTITPVVVIAPSNIVAYLPITLTNYQSTAVVANTPIAIGTTTSGNVIGFNAANTAYQQYETCNLNNAEFFLANGMVLNSWMEGNVPNADAANALCTSDASPNALAASSNVLYWVKMPAGTFLMANTYTAATIYLGWSGNVVTTANTLLSNTTTGENPYISSTFGQYDNGGNVFSLYSTFQGNTMPYGWNAVSTDGSYTPTFIGGTSAAGGLEMMNNVGGTTALKYNSTFNTSNIIVEASWSANGGADDLGIGIYANSVISGTAGGYNPQSTGGYYAPYEFWNGGKPEFLSGTTVLGSASSQDMATSGDNFVMSQFTITNTKAVMNFTETTATIYETPVYSGLKNPVTVSTSISNANSLFYIGSSDGGTSAYIYLYWLRARLYPPNGILPGTTYGAVTQATTSTTSTTTTSTSTSTTSTSTSTTSSTSTSTTVATTSATTSASTSVSTSTSTTTTSTSTSTSTVPASTSISSTSTSTTSTSTTSTSVTTTSATTTISNSASTPYSGGSTGFFGNSPGTTIASTSSTTIPTTSTVLPATTVATLPGTTQVCNDISGYDADYGSLNATLHIKSASSICFSVTAENVTSKYQKSNSSIINAINYSTSDSRNASLSITIHHSCSIPYYEVYPAILRNNTWQRINPFTYNISACTITFAAPSDPVIALFSTNPTLPTTAVSTPATTAASNTTTPSNSSTNKQNQDIIWAVITVIAVMIILFVYSRTRKRY